MAAQGEKTIPLSSRETTPTLPAQEKAQSQISLSSTLAERDRAYPIKRGPVTDAIFRLFKRKQGEKDFLDDIATQPSVYDGPQAEHYQPRADWENIEAFDPSFRWTWREEITAIRKVDFKVLTWVCFMFFALGKLSAYFYGSSLRLQTSIGPTSRQPQPTTSWTTLTSLRQTIIWATRCQSSGFSWPSYHLSLSRKD